MPWLNPSLQFSAEQEEQRAQGEPIGDTYGKESEHFLVIDPQFPLIPRGPLLGPRWRGKPLAEDAPQE